MENNQSIKDILLSETTIEGFSASIYVNHLEEASFMYERKRYLRQDWEYFWKDFHDFENRLETHLYGLVSGGELSAEVCKYRAIESDFGELHTAVRILCRQNRQDLVKTLIDDLDFDDDEYVKAFTDALCFELPETWHQTLIPFLFERGPEAACIMADVIAFKRIPFDTLLIEALSKHSTNKKAVRTILAALAIIRSKESKTTAANYLRHDDPDIVESAASVLIRTGDKKTALAISKADWNPVDRSICGGKNEFSGVEFNNNKETLLSMGLIGNVSEIPFLITMLLNEDFGENAALALNLITGAESYEEHFVPEEIDEDTLFEDELEKYRKGELYAPGEEPGETITRLSRNQAEWEQWWDEHKTSFDPELRYRSGKPYSPQCLIENLKMEKSPDVIRKLAYEELVVRYNVNVPFETEMTVKYQIDAIDKMEQKVNAVAGQFKDGTWYYNGSLV